jgi:hypothetical protein
MTSRKTRNVAGYVLVGGGYQAGQPRVRRAAGRLPFQSLRSNLAMASYRAEGMQLRVYSAEARNWLVT